MASRKRTSSSSEPVRLAGLPAEVRELTTPHPRQPRCPGGWCLRCSHLADVRRRTSPRSRLRPPEEVCRPLGLAAEGPPPRLERRSPAARRGDARRRLRRTALVVGAGPAAGSGREGSAPQETRPRAVVASALPPCGPVLRWRRMEAGAPQHHGVDQALVGLGVAGLGEPGVGRVGDVAVPPAVVARVGVHPWDRNGR